MLDREPANYWFLNQETKAPYLVSVCELDLNALEAGREENARAAEIFDRCLQRGQWPGYRHKDDPDHDRAFRVGLPNYALAKIEQRI